MERACYAGCVGFSSKRLFLVELGLKEIQMVKSSSGLWERGAKYYYVQAVQEVGTETRAGQKPELQIRHSARAPASHASLSRLAATKIHKFRCTGLTRSIVAEQSP